MLKFLDLLCSAAQLCMTPLTVAHQTLLYKEFPRREYWSKLPFPTPGDLPDPGIKPMTLTSPALAGRFFTTSTTWGMLKYSQKTEYLTMRLLVTQSCQTLQPHGL